MSECKKCEVCAESSHHWVDNPTGDATDPQYICKHCDAVGDACETCWGEDRPPDFACPECDGEGIMEK